MGSANFVVSVQDKGFPFAEHKVFAMGSAKFVIGALDTSFFF